MCGVVSIVYEALNERLGREAAALLKKLEYRGYDSTGAAFIGAGGSVLLKKSVGSPSHVIRALEIDRDAGHTFVGQVRWATYGSVTDTNAQPHEVRCRQHLVGAHNGNISNTDTLKEFLTDHGHDVRSDNDGEILVHVIEHYLDEVLRQRAPDTDAGRVDAVIEAIRRAQRRVEGSYAACVTLPALPGVFAMKSGSSLYAGKGSDAAGDFVVVSSDLTSVLSKTRFLIPLSEGEGLYFTHDRYRVFSLTADREHQPRLKRSRLNIADISLRSRYRYFMHQEIDSAPEGVDRIVKYYFREAEERELFGVFEDHRPRCKSIVSALLELYDIFDPTALRQALDALLDGEDVTALMEAASRVDVPWPDAALPPPFTSDEAQLLDELGEVDPGRHRELWMLDQLIIWKKKRKVTWFRDRLRELLQQTAAAGGRIFAIGAGTSYHASLVGAYLFNDIAHIGIVPVNPGMFRSMYLDALHPHDLIIGVTQSGETKDLLDIYNDVRSRHGDDIRLVTLVNNELSTIPQEKSDFFLPILCGPEVAVAATKSFISQVVLFHLFACACVMDSRAVKERITRIRAVIDFTLRAVEEDTEEVALRFFMRPSMHILGTSMIGLAKEGALKIREVVLNHTEGYDSAEFKHGPNTILGKNTIYSLGDLERLLADSFEYLGSLCRTELRGDDGAAARIELLLAMLRDVGFRSLDLERPEPGQTGDFWTLQDAYARYKSRIDVDRYFSNYPLIFFCPPVERDVKITISQIHTHKIRGADVVLIARDDDRLRRSVEGVPAEVRNYYSKYIRLPGMFDQHMFVYQAAVVLQLLALKMSIHKMKYLNKVHVQNHGVHPDVPKNVSKSITVD